MGKTLYQVQRTADVTPLWSQVELANMPWTRLRGLLGRTGLGSEEGLWFKPCNSIHSIGMKFAFDAVFLDKHGKVLALQANIEPGKLLPIVWGASQVLELAAGAVDARGLLIGDSLALMPVQQATVAS